MTEPTVAPTPKDDDADGEAAAHSIEATREVASSIRDLLDEDDEGELSPYKGVTTSGKNVTFKLTNDDTDLAYLVTISPLED